MRTLLVSASFNARASIRCACLVSLLLVVSGPAEEEALLCCNPDDGDDAPWPAVPAPLVACAVSGRTRCHIPPCSSIACISTHQPTKSAGSSGMVDGARKAAE